MFPALDSTGPVSFVAGPDQMIIRPRDFVPGYLVPDGKPARGLPGALGHGGAVLPGPRPGEVWVQDGYRSRLTLARLDGRATGVSMRLPGGGMWLASANGRGYVLLSGAGEIYDVWPGGSRHIGGTLAAVGPTRWLTVSCDRPHRCADEITNPATGAQRTLGGPPDTSVSAASPGVIAPDGATAAIYRVTAGGRVTLHLLSLATGTDHPIAVPLDPGWGSRAAGLVPRQPLAVRDHRARRGGGGEPWHPARRGPGHPAPLAQPDSDQDRPR